MLVPGADDLITFRATGGRLAGLDNGRQEDAEGYKASAHTAFNGKALAIVQADRRGGPLHRDRERPRAAPAPRPSVARDGCAGRCRTRAAGARRRAPTEEPAADASYSGAQDTLPAAMLDGDPATAWSNFYAKDATALLPAFSLAHAADWVSLRWPTARSVDSVSASFTVDATHQLPAAVAVSAWNGRRWVPVAHPHVAWAATSGEPTTVTFDPVTTTQLKLDMTSRAPRTGTGFLAITELRAASG